MFSCSSGKVNFKASKSETRRAFPVHMLQARPTRSLMSGLMGRPSSLQYCNKAAFHEVAGRSFHVRVVPIEGPDQPAATFTAFVSTTHCLVAVPMYSKLRALIEDSYDFASSLQLGLVSKHLESSPPNPINMMDVRSKVEPKLTPGNDLLPCCAGAQCAGISSRSKRWKSCPDPILLRKPPSVCSAIVLVSSRASDGYDPTKAVTGPQRSSN